MKSLIQIEIVKTPYDEKCLEGSSTKIIKTVRIIGIPIYQTVSRISRE